MFHLNYIPKPSEKKITHQDSMLFIGSCFSEHIGSKLSDLKFNVVSNPTGILFNPISISKTILNFINKSEINTEHLIERDATWFYLDAHSSFSAPSRNSIILKFDDIQQEWFNKLKQTQWLIITFGSAYYYEYKSTQQVVANCHKLPSENFDKKLASVSEIVSQYDALIKTLLTINPILSILFTVSPVKHLRDGVIENNLSKSILIQSVHEIVNKHKACFYFPAYEIVTDDLRDYRFYETDMAHPNAQAINYVFNKFEDVFFDETTQKLNNQIREINQAYSHKPFNATSNSHQAFKQSMSVKCNDLKKTVPHINLDVEALYFNTPETN